MIKALFIFVFCLSSLIGQAQDEPPQKVYSKHNVYFNIGALLNIPSGIQVGYDRNIFNNTNLDIQGGVLLYSKQATISDFNATNKRGIRWQATLKNYRSSRFYLGPTVLFKYVAMDEKMWVRRYENSYMQNMDLVRFRRTIAGGIELGYEGNFINSPWMVEVSYGLGIQNLNVRYENLAPDATVEHFRGLGIREGTRYLPFINFGVRLKYPISEIKMKKAR